MSEPAPTTGFPAPPVAPSSDGDGLADVSDLCFRYQECDIPPGMTLAQWRRRDKNAPAALPGRER